MQKRRYKNRSLFIRKSILHKLLNKVWAQKKAVPNLKGSELLS